MRRKARTAPRPSKKRSGSWSQRFRALLAGMIGLALLIGVPYCLVRFVGNPIESFPNSLGEVSDYFARRFIPSDVIAGLLAIVMWLLWLQYVWALLWELAVVGPAAAKGKLVRAAPLAPRAVRSVASAVVSGLLTASVVVSSSSLASIGAHAIATPAALATESHPSINEPAQTVAESAAMDGRSVYVVGQRESLWSIAGQDEAVLKRLLEINEDQIRSPIDVRPGMELIVPVGLISEGVDEAGVGEQNQISDRGRFDRGQAHSHTVVEGDNLWDLSEARLRNENGADPSNREIAERVADVVDRNQEVIEDPDLIYPGEVLAIPTALDGLQSIPAPSSPPADNEQGQTVSAAQLESPADETRPLDAIAGAESTDEPTLDREPANGSQASDAAAADDPDSATVQADGQADEKPVALPVVAAAIAGGLTAAGGLLGVLLGLKRRRAATLGFTSARRLDDVEGDRLIRDLAGGADHQFTLWVADRLHDLMARLPSAEGMTPSAVRLALSSWLSAESGMTVLWDAPMPNPITPWQAINEREWFLAYDDTTATVPAESKPAPLPGLVTVGQLTDIQQPGQELLIDLEAHASMALGGSADQINAVARAIAYEAAAGELLSNFRVTTVDFTFEGLDVLERLSSRSEELALAHAETIVEQYRRRATEEPSLGNAPLARDVELFILNTVQANTDRWLEIATPRSGIAVLLVGDMRSSRLGARLAISDGGVGTLSPLGVELNVGGILPESAIQLGALFDQLAEPSQNIDVAPVVSPAEVVGDWADSDHASLSRAATAPVAGVGLVISVLGQCRCEALPELEARALSLVAFLAVQPDQTATREVIADAVWGGRRVSDGQFSKVVAAARAQLGPIRLPKQLSADGLYRLEQVETDFHQFQRTVLHAENLEAAEAAPLLKAALDLVSGPPFGGVAIDWAVGRRFDEYCSELIEATTVRAIEVLSVVGDHVNVHEVAKIGLRALPANEPIYRAYMREAASRGELPFVRSMYEHLCEKLSLLYPTENRQPSRETDDLLAELTGPVPAQQY